MIPALASALSGIRTDIGRLDRAADRLSRGGADADLASNLVALEVARNGVAANVKAARAADETIGTLLDVLA
ncbi:MAG: hypothetical protein U0Q12_17950 [Vicinamibacterales bacterium]